MKKSKRTLVVWMPVLTDHEAYTLNSLAYLMDSLPLNCYVASYEHPLRKKNGWSETRVKTINRTLIPSNFSLLFCFAHLFKARHNIHIFGSPFENPMLIITIFLAAFLKIEFYLVSEPYSTSTHGLLKKEFLLIAKFKNFFRPILYRFYIKILGSKVSGIFAISEQALSQYMKNGIKREKLFPFGYFVPSKAQYCNENFLKIKGFKNKTLKVIFIGNLIPVKGLDILISAIEHCFFKGFNITLDIYGPGNPEDYKINNKFIHYKGVIPFGESQSYITNYDILILPSRYDGWGLVVNEAILAKVPVFCSDRVGSKTLVHNLGCGKVYPSNNYILLSKMLINLLLHPGDLGKIKNACVSASKIIKPNIAAKYMHKIIIAPSNLKSKIVAPWIKR